MLHSLIMASRGHSLQKRCELDAPWSFLSPSRGYRDVVANTAALRAPDLRVLYCFRFHHHVLAADIWSVLLCRLLHGLVSICLHHLDSVRAHLCALHLRLPPPRFLPPFVAAAPSTAPRCPATASRLHRRPSLPLVIPLVHVRAAHFGGAYH